MLQHMSQCGIFSIWNATRKVLRSSYAFSDHFGEKTMGGLDSGRLREVNTQPTVENVLCIDIRSIKKQGMLQHGLSGTLSWSGSDRCSGSVNFHIDYDCLVLNYYSYTSSDGWQPVEETIWF